MPTTSVTMFRYLDHKLTKNQKSNFCIGLDVLQRILLGRSREEGKRKEEEEIRKRRYFIVCYNLHHNTS